MSLKTRLADQIRASGPLTVPAFMTACLHDPQDGYYATRPALGADGDFITAPLVSQMFGELIGLWAVETWRRLGRPSPFRLIEAGPGDGTLMGDLLRAARLDPAFLAAADLWLVETSQPLIARQAERLAAVSLQPRWAAALAEVPEGAPMILIANELLDCLPVEQFIWMGDTFCERLVGLDEAGELCFGLGPAQKMPTSSADPGLEPGTVLEMAGPQNALGIIIGAHIARNGGAALLIDYGDEGPGLGDTLQALKRHQKVDVLATAGEADLTVHARFKSVADAARSEGAATALLTQGQFLRRLGIEARAATLARARPDQAATIERQLARLIDRDQMGMLFKALCLYGADQPPPPAFEPAL